MTSKATKIEIISKTHEEFVSRPDCSNENFYMKLIHLKNSVFMKVWLGAFLSNLLLFALNTNLFSQITYTTPGTYSWTVPACVTSVTVQAWGGGGGGGGVSSYIVSGFNTDNEACSTGGGGGGGGFVSRTYSVIPGEVYTIVVGGGGTGGPGSNVSSAACNGGSGGNSTFSGPATIIPGVLTAFGGNFGGGARTYNNNSGMHEGTNGSLGTGGSGSNGTTIIAGGNGATGKHDGSCHDQSGGGGGGAGTTVAGGNATTLVCWGSQTGGSAGTSFGGTGANGTQGSFCKSCSDPYSGTAGNTIGAGGSGALLHFNDWFNQWKTASGGAGARGEVRLTYTTSTPPAVGITNNSGTTVITCTTTAISLTALPAGQSSYTWSGGSTPTTAPNSLSTPGTYTVTVSDAGGCSASANITITQDNTPPTAGITNNTGTAILTCTTNAINITATPAGAASYLWSGGSTPGTANNSLTSVGTYTVTVTSANGCTNNEIITISQNITPPTAGITNNSGTTLLTCTTNAISVTAIPAGASSYTWSGGATPSLASNSFTSAGTYTVTVTAANGCTDDEVITITQNNSPPIAGITNNSGTAILTCTTTAISATATPAGAASYTWSAGATPGTANNTFTAAGTYTVTVTAANGCSDIKSITITQNVVSPTANAGSDQSVCPGDPAVLTATGGGTYAWSNGDNAASTSVTPAVTSTYTVTVTDATNGCTNSDNVLVTVGSNVIANAGPDQTICKGQPAILNATGGSTFLWSNSANTSSIIVSPTSTSIYSVTVSSGNCSATDEIQINVNAVPDYNISPDQTICSGGSIVLSANVFGGGTYSWSNGNNTNSTNVSPSTTTTYTVTMTGSNGCSIVDSILITVNNTPIADAGSDITICNGESHTLTATGGGSYLWSNSIATDTTTVSPAITTTFTVTVTNTGCIATDSIRITVNSLPLADAGTDNTICSGNSVLLIATGGGTYIWDDSSTNDSLSVTPTGTMTYSVTVTNSNGCTASSDVVVNVNAIPIADAGSDQTICAGQIAALNATGGSIYAWSNSSNTAAINVSPSATTIYFVIVTNNGCSDTDTVQVYVTPLPMADAGNNQTICAGQSTLLVATGGGNYLWTTSSVNDSINVTPASTTTFTVTVTNNGCSSSDNVVVTVNNTPSANAGNDQSICLGESATLTATGGSTYTWSNSVNTASTVVSPTSATIYSVTVIANGCTDTDDITVTVNPLPTADAGSDQSICAGSNATLTASGGGIYLWSNNQTTASINVSPSTTISYTVTVTNLQGCSDSDNVMLTVYPIPVVSFSGLNNLYCESASSEILTGIPSGGTFSGSGMNGNLFDPALAGIGGPYSVTYNYSDTNGCSNSATQNVSVSATPTVNLTSIPTNGNAYLGQLITFNANPANYPGYVFFVDSTEVQNSPSYIYQDGTLQDGQVVYVMVSENGCVVEDSIIIDIHPIPNAFTPDGNGKNDLFVPGLDLTIINRWDQVLYEGTDGWDGRYNGNMVSPGTYFYIIRLADASNNKKELHGTLTLVHPQ